MKDSDPAGSHIIQMYTMVAVCYIKFPRGSRNFNFMTGFSNIAPLLVFLLFDIVMKEMCNILTLPKKIV